MPQVGAFPEQGDGVRGADAVYSKPSGLPFGNTAIVRGGVAAKRAVQGITTIRERV